jgi:streptogramin lyase
MAAAAVVAALLAGSGREARAQSNPYQLVANWAKLSGGRTFGSVIGAGVDRAGNVWAFDRCGTESCDGSDLNPILQFDASGNLVKSIGAGLFIFPHGFYLDRDGNIWTTDGMGKDGKGFQVTKLSPDGRVLLQLGKAGLAGTMRDTDAFIYPSAVVTGANGDIYVADGHGEDTGGRIMKFSRDGRFIKQWGRKGTGAGEFGGLHAIGMDSQGRIFVGDRTNSRIQVFDGEGKFLAEWKQFGRPSGIFIDANDTIYVADSQSDAQRNPGFQKGIRIGSVRDGVVRSFIPIPGPGEGAMVSAEGVTADAAGNVYGAEANSNNLRKYVKR